MSNQGAGHDAMDREAIIPGIDLDLRAVEPGNSPTLERYTRDRLSITHQIRLLENLFRGRRNDARASQCHELMVKLAEDRFTLAVVGQFKRGKSSLMNALMGRELLPTGVLPITSAITILRYGPRERLVVTWQDSGFDRSEPLSALNDYVTERGNPGNRKKVRAAYVEVPSAFLRRGLEFVDTPGIGSAIEENTATTCAFIPNCDAVVFVTGVDAPMTDAELEFLSRLRQDVGKLFCVVNKIDLVDQPQRSQVIGFVAEQIRKALGRSDLPVFCVSSRLALAGDVRGIEELQDALGGFLSGQHTSVLLKAVAERALRLLAVERDDMLRTQRAAAIPVEAREDRAAQIRSRFEAAVRKMSNAAGLMTAEMRSGVIDSDIAKLDERIRLGIVGLADGLATSIAPGDWESAGNFIAVLARNVAEAAQLELNEWLAGRAHAVDSRLTEAAAALGDLVLRLLADVETELLADRLPQFDDFKFTCDGVAAEQWRTQSTSWAPTPPRLVRYMPVSIVRRRLRKWLHQWAEEFGQRLREKAIGLAHDYLVAQMRRLTDALTRFLREEEKRIVAAVTSPPSMADELERAEQIEDALASILHSEGSPRRGKRAQPTVPEFAAAPVTAESLQRDMRAGGCAVCRHLGRVLFDFFVTWQHLMAADDAAQRQYAREFGFCPLHTWQLASVSSPRGLSVGYPRLAERLHADLGAIARNDPSAEAVARLAANAKSCRACRTMAWVQDDCVRRLSDLLAHDAGRQSYAASQGVCLKHLPALLAAVVDPAVKPFVIDVAAAQLQTLGEDMQSFALKQEATRRELVNSNERHALRAALEKIVGFKSLCFAWEFDEVN
jgi:GTP-binding protein EngB required for normal cell division